MAEEEDTPKEPDDLEDAANSDDDGDGGGEELDPLAAEEMLKMMEEKDEGEGGSGAGGMDLGSAMGGMAPSGGASGGGGIPPNIARLMDVNLSVTIELGRSTQTLEYVLQLGEQSLVELDKQVGEPVDILVNGKIFARGEVVTVSENFGVRITELLAGVSEL